MVWVCSRSPIIRYSEFRICNCCKDKYKYTNQNAILLFMCNRCSFFFAGQIPSDGGRMSTLGSAQFSVF